MKTEQIISAGPDYIMLISTHSGICMKTTTAQSILRIDAILWNSLIIISHLSVDNNFNNNHPMLCNLISNNNGLLTEILYYILLTVI